MDMDSEQYTNDLGVCVTNIYKIKSEEQYQSIAAFIDLKQCIR